MEGAGSPVRSALDSNDTSPGQARFAVLVIIRTQANMPEAMFPCEITRAGLCWVVSRLA